MRADLGVRVPISMNALYPQLKATLDNGCLYSGKYRREMKREEERRRERKSGEEREREGKREDET